MPTPEEKSEETLSDIDSTNSDMDLSDDDLDDLDDLDDDELDDDLSVSKQTKEYVDDEGNEEDTEEKAEEDDEEEQDEENEAETTKLRKVIGFFVKIKQRAEEARETVYSKLHTAKNKVLGAAATVGNKIDDIKKEIKKETTPEKPTKAKDLSKDILFDVEGYARKQTAKRKKEKDQRKKEREDEKAEQEQKKKHEEEVRKDSYISDAVVQHLTELREKQKQAKKALEGVTEKQEKEKKQAELDSYSDEKIAEKSAEKVLALAKEKASLQEEADKAAGIERKEEKGERYDYLRHALDEAKSSDEEAQKAIAAAREKYAKQQDQKMGIIFGIRSVIEEQEKEKKAKEDLLNSAASSKDKERIQEYINETYSKEKIEEKAAEEALKRAKAKREYLWGSEEGHTILDVLGMEVPKDDDTDKARIEKILESAKTMYNEEDAAKKAQDEERKKAEEEQYDSSKMQEKALADLKTREDAIDKAIAEAKNQKDEKLVLALESEREKLNAEKAQAAIKAQQDTERKIQEKDKKQKEDAERAAKEEADKKSKEAQKELDEAMERAEKAKKAAEESAKTEKDKSEQKKSKEDTDKKDGEEEEKDEQSADPNIEFFNLIRGIKLPDYLSEDEDFFYNEKTQKKYEDECNKKYKLCLQALPYLRNFKDIKQILNSNIDNLSKLVNNKPSDNEVAQSENPDKKGTIHFEKIYQDRQKRKNEEQIITNLKNDINRTLNFHASSITRLEDCIRKISAPPSPGEKDKSIPYIIEMSNFLNKLDVSLRNASSRIKYNDSLSKQIKDIDEKIHARNFKDMGKVFLLTRPIFMRDTYGNYVTDENGNPKQFKAYVKANGSFYGRQNRGRNSQQQNSIGNYFVAFLRSTINVCIVQKKIDPGSSEKLDQIISRCKPLSEKRYDTIDMGQISTHIKDLLTHTLTNEVIIALEKSNTAGYSKELNATKLSQIRTSLESLQSTNPNLSNIEREILKLNDFQAVDGITTPPKELVADIYKCGNIYQGLSET